MSARDYAARADILAEKAQTMWHAGTWLDAAHLYQIAMQTVVDESKATEYRGAAQWCNDQACVVQQSYGIA